MPGFLEDKVHQAQKVTSDSLEMLVNVEDKGHWAPKVGTEVLVHLAYEDPQGRPESQDLKVLQDKMALKAQKEMLAHQAFKGQKVSKDRLAPQEEVRQ